MPGYPLPRQRAFLLVAVIAIALLYVARPDAKASHQPANKVAVAGSSMVVEGPGTDVVLLSQSFRASATDLILQAAVECTLVTDVKTVGDDDARAAGEMKIWVEIDDVVVPVSSNDTADPGKVIACHRAYQRTTTLFDDTNATIETFFTTKSTHGFNWLALNLSPGIHKVELVAELTEEMTPGNATAEIVVGKRTLIGIPTKLPHDATIDSGVAD